MIKTLDQLLEVLQGAKNSSKKPGKKKGKKAKVKFD